MTELKICRICLRTETTMYKHDKFHLKSYYEEVMALKMNENDGLPQHFCYECAVMLHKFHKFKEKCYCGQKTLKEMLWKGAITYEAIYKVDRSNKYLQSSIDVMQVTNRVKLYVVKDSLEEQPCIKPENQRIHKIEVEFEGKHSDQNYLDITEATFDMEPKSPDSIFIDVKKEAVELDKVEIRTKKKVQKTIFENKLKKYHSITNRRTRFLDAKKWEKYTLTEEEAVQEFRARSENRKYLKASYKCTDCFKGFSKEDMLKRHIQLRHSELLGVFECRFCRMRFKWDSHLRIHMRQHFTKYQCLRCPFICPLENTALMHEEYHSGVKKKCIHCEQEFRHSSTYYTHLRTAHRSEFVCTLCGVSFVSEAGLHQHKRVKHVNDEIDSPEDDDEVNTHCEKCDITFETRKAYEEHVFHSIMHADGVEHQLQDEITIPSKVLGKKMKEKITRQMRKRRPEDIIFPLEARRQKKQKRQLRKPTTCHQCGKHFDTQAACMKHHISEHPRTSFYPPNKRHICEICGASLAPGSVAVHQNMHSREKLHSCETCGRQFHSSVGLKRHMVTHTGEKPFACTSCDKRFTQSNSMKLHYRTFHLKQPYPKRNRRKKKDEPQDQVDMEDSTSEEESDTSLPEPDMEMAPENHSKVDHVSASTLVPDMQIPGETVHYLTLH